MMQREIYENMLNEEKYLEVLEVKMAVKLEIHLLALKKLVKSLE